MVNKNMKTIIALTLVTIAFGASIYASESKYKKAISEINELNSTIENINKLYEQTLDEKEEMQIELSEISEELERARRDIEKYTRITNFNEYDLTQISNASVVHMKKALKGTLLEQSAHSFVQAEEEYGVNAYFIAAIAAQESNWGKSARAKYQNNLTGHAVYNSNAKGTYFNSWHENIMLTAKMLKQNYLTPGGIYYNGVSTVDVNMKYCFYEDGETVDYKWSTSINSIARSLRYKGNN